MLKKFNIIWLDKFGLEWFDTAYGLDKSAACQSFKADHPECRHIDAKEC